MPVLRLELIIGCMFAGKSNELLRRARRLEAIGDKVLVINHVYDTRTCHSVKTHDGVKVSALKVDSLMSIIQTEQFREANAICIDEGQFFEDIRRFVEIIERESKTVVIAALDCDWKREPFQNIINLIPLADSVVKLSALERLPNGDIVEANYSMLMKEYMGNDVMIGGADMYKAVSRETYLKMRSIE